MCMCNGQNMVVGIGTFGGCNRGCNQYGIRLCENGCGGVDVQFADRQIRSDEGIGCKRRRCCCCCCCKHGKSGCCG